MIGVAIVLPDVSVLQEAAAKVVTELVKQLNALPPFGVQVIEAMPEATSLVNVGLDEPFVRESLAHVEESIWDNAFGPAALVEGLQQHKLLIDVDVARHCELYVESVHPIHETHAEVQKFLEPAAAIKEALPESLTIRMFRVATRTFKAEIKDKSLDVRSRLLTSLAADVLERNRGMKQHFGKMMQRILTKPETAEQLAELQEYTTGLSTEVAELQLEQRKISKSMELLEALGYPMTSEDVDSYWVAVGQPAELTKAQGLVVQRQEDERLKFMQDLREDTENFKLELKSIDTEIEKLLLYTNIEMAEEYAGTMSVLEMRLKEAEERALVINSRETLFELEVSDFTDIASVIKTFEPYSMLWTTTSQFHHQHPNWMHGSFDKLDANTMSENITAWLKYAVRASKVFDGKKEPLSVLSALREQLEETKEYLPVISALRIPGMKDRHWDKLGDLMMQSLSSAQITLKQLLDMRVTDYLTDIQNISDVAEKEYKFEFALEKMRGEWRDLVFEVSPYKDTGTYVVKGVDEVVALLDDQIVKVQGMRGSPYAKGQLGTVVIDWNNKLIYMQDALDELLKVQKTWLYLEPIFASPDILRQMPTEGRRFQKVDVTFRSIMETASQVPQVLQVMGMETLKENLIEANKMLDMVQKGLNDYLETKRSFFPRFYFLSNDELLDILSETKDPRRVVPHLSKCFEAMSEVSFRGKNVEQQNEGGKMLDIMAMISGEGEIVELFTVVEPDADRNKGSVERWLVEMETSMRDTLKEEGSKAFEAYKMTERPKFVQEWTGMIVLAADCLYWTRDVEDGMREKGLEGVKDVEKKMVAELTDVVALVRGDISRQTRLILGAMVVLDVHNKDVVSLLIANNVSKPSEFDWNSQLRYYLHSPTFDAPWHRKGEEVVTTRMMNAQLAYGYEYLGNSMRLVVTPLTDRCYRTLFGALHLSLGGAPEGPAGTGKTETVKDLAKAIAKQCIVFNCSDGLDYLAMAKFFKGLSSCGAWACFDEFNRIDLEVLSVIAQQILTLNDAIRQGIKEIVFEGSQIQCVKGYSSFITMNPGCMYVCMGVYIIIYRYI
jgi:dynein heavy chain, axonemal